MHRIEGPYIGLDAQGNPIFKETPLPPTAVPADWLNAIQEEIATLIEYTGLELQTAGTDTWDQLKKSIFNRSPLYTTDLAEALFIRFQNSATGYTSTDGTRFGIDAAGNTEIWNYEATDILFATAGIERFRVKDDGRLSTGAESAPDVDPGGLCLNQGTNNEKILTFKQANVNHGITQQSETDTYGFLKIHSIDSGGLIIEGETGDTGAISIRGVGTTTGIGETEGSDGTAKIDGSKKSGTGYTACSGLENAIVLTSGDLTKWIMKGDGHIYNDYSTTMTLYDNENDIELGRALQQKIGGIKISKNMTNKLQTLGIINKEGFACQQTLTALQLGISSQLSNMIRHFAKHTGVAESQLLEWSKDYS